MSFLIYTIVIVLLFFGLAWLENIITKNRVKVSIKPKIKKVSNEYSE